MAHVSACLRLYELSGDPRDFPPYIDLNRLLRRGETTRLCLEALAKEGPLSTRELAQRVMRAPYALVCLSRSVCTIISRLSFPASLLRRVGEQIRPAVVDVRVLAPHRRIETAGKRRLQLRVGET